MKIKLNSLELAQVYRTRREERSNGGFQSLMVRLQDKINSSLTGELDLNEQDIAQIAKYAAYDKGGFEGRLQEAFGRHLPDLFPNRVTVSLFG